MNRILFDTNIGNLLCSDISEIKEGKRILLTEEIDVEFKTKSIFDQNKNLTMQIWINNDKIHFATRTKGYIRQTRIKFGLFNKFYKQIEKPAKGGGYYKLSILDSKYSGTLVSGPINELDKRDFDKRIQIIDKEIIPKLLKLINGEIVKERTGYNV